MKRFLIPLVFCIQIGALQGQSLDRSVIGAAGNSLVKENLMLSFTVGETAISTASGSSLVVTEGFQQSGIHELISAIDEIAFIHGLQVYPNPTTGLLNFGIPEENQFDISVGLYDILGKRINLSEPTLVAGNRYQVDLGDLAVGTYQMVVKMGSGQLHKIFKVQKIY